MKYLIFVFIFLLISISARSGEVYWCGDHPCINKKEKEAYFKKTMTVEIRELSNKSIEEKSEIEKLIQQAKIDEKKRITKEKDLLKEIKAEEKRKIKEKKILEKEAKANEKKRIKKSGTEQERINEEEILTREIEAELSREIRAEEETISENSKKITNVDEKKEKSKELVSENSASISYDKSISSFESLVHTIMEKNTLKSYPEINEINK